MEFTPKEIKVVPHSGLYRGMKLALCVIICVLLSLMLLGINKGLYSVTLSVLAVGLLLCGSLPLCRWSVIDWIVTALVLFDIVSPFYSICRVPAIDTACGSFLVWAAYVLLRRLFDDGHLAAVLINGLGLVGIVAMVVAVVTFVLCSNKARNVGFDDIYMVRYLYRPLGFPNNCWAEIALLMTGVGCLCKRFRGIIVYLSVLSLLLTFSRGAYVSLAILALVLMFFLKPFKKFKGIFIGMLFAMLTVVVIYPKEMITTVSMTKTLSQRNSLDWRKNTTDNAIKEFWQRPAAGFGNNAFPLVADVESHGGAFTVTAPNLPSLVLVEKGLIGSVMWLSLIAFVAILFFKNKKDSGVIISGAALLALLAKELSQSVMAYVPVVELLAVFLLAYMQRVQYICAGPVSRIAGILVVICAFPCLSKRCWADCVRDNDSKLLAEAISSISNDEIPAAIERLEAIEGIRRYDRYANFVLSELYFQTGQYDKLYSVVSDNMGGFGMWLKGRALYSEGRKQEAVCFLSDAIIQMPSLITTADFEFIKSEDVDMYFQLQIN